VAPLSFEAGLDTILRRSPAQAWTGRAARRRLAVLAYHDVSDATTFARQMAYVRECFHPVTVDEVIASVSRGAPLPERAVLVTFDDGHRSVLEAGLPILRRLDLPAVVYVVAGLLDTDEPFWWTEVRALVQRGGRCAGVASGTAPLDAVRALKRVPDGERRAAIEQLRASAREPAPRTPQLRREELLVLERGGVAIGNHTLTHPCLDRCTDEQLQNELEAAQRVLAEPLGRAPRSLAYPNGDQDARVRKAAADCGFGAAFLFDHRLSENPPADRLAVSRLRVNSDTSLDRFEIILSGLHPAIHHALGRH
jgi:peptidoglycan/xylan/chitin deacetylase (PgdA/CDA1 family)